MNEEDKQKMSAHGITHETQSVFFYKGHKYDRLDDAVRYAQIESAQAQKGGGDS